MKTNHIKRNIPIFVEGSKVGEVIASKEFLDYLEHVSEERKKQAHKRFHVQ